MKHKIMVFATLIPSATFGALVTTWTAPQDAASLGDAGAPSVLLSPDPVLGGLEFTSAVSGTGTDFTDVVVLTTTQQTQLASAGLTVTQGLDNVRGATRRLTGPSLDAIGNGGLGGGNLTTRNATLDLFLSPDNLNDATQLIFETGGSGAGSSLNMSGPVMTLGVATNAATATTASVNLAALYGATPNTGDMLHVRATFDLANDEVVLSVLNLATGLGASGVTTFTGTDWAGTDGMGIFNLQGTVGGSAGGNVPTGYSNFDGQFAGLQLYGAEVLAPVPEPSASVMMLLACVGAAGFRRRSQDFD